MSNHHILQIPSSTLREQHKLNQERNQFPWRGASQKFLIVWESTPQLLLHIIFKAWKFKFNSTWKGGKQKMPEESKAGDPKTAQQREGIDLWRAAVEFYNGNPLHSQISVC